MISLETIKDCYLYTGIVMYIKDSSAVVTFFIGNGIACLTIYIYIYINYQSGAAPCLTQNHPDLQYIYIYIADKGRLHV